MDSVPELRSGATVVARGRLLIRHRNFIAPGGELPSDDKCSAPSGPPGRDIPGAHIDRTFNTLTKYLRRT
jgi:hypothetical protein